WTTSVGGSSQVEYGTSTSYGAMTTLDPTLLTSHSQSLSGLSANTLYHYRVHSKPSNGVDVASSDATFSTTTNGGSSFPGLPTGIGWHSLGGGTALSTSPSDNTAPVLAPSTGSTNQCPINNYNGTTYAYHDLCHNVIDAQSEGVADTF